MFHRRNVSFWKIAKLNSPHFRSCSSRINCISTSHYIHFICAYLGRGRLKCKVCYHLRRQFLTNRLICHAAMLFRHFGVRYLLIAANSSIKVGPDALLKALRSPSIIHTFPKYRILTIDPVNCLKIPRLARYSVWGGPEAARIYTVMSDECWSINTTAKQEWTCTTYTWHYHVEESIALEY